MNIKEEFNNCVKEFCNLELYEKRQVIIDDLIETLSIVDKVASDIGNERELLLNREILDAKNLQECSEDDFNEALFVYLHSIREPLGAILEKIGNDYYN